MEIYKTNSLSEAIEGNSSEICKLIESKCLKPIEITPSSLYYKENSSEYYFHKGYSFRLKGDFDSAIAQYRLGLKKDETHKGLKISLGVCLMKLGLQKKAIKLFQSTQDVCAYINLGICYISSQQYSLAVDYIKKAISIEYKPKYQQLLSLALFRSGRVSEALETFHNVDPGESLMEDERKLTNPKKSNRVFPFKVGEITKGPSRTVSSRRDSRNSGRVSVLSTYSPNKSPRLSLKTRKSSESLEKDKKNKSITEFSYQPKLRPELPTYDEILSKKYQIDTIIRKRHNTLIGAMQSNLIDIKYNGFIQQKLETQNESPYKDLYTIKDYHYKVDILHRELNFNRYPVEFREEFDQKKFEGKRLGEHSIKVLDFEYEKDFYDRNYEVIEEIVKTLPFFAKFPADIRQKLLKCAVYKNYEPEEIIIKQGEAGDSMFVIISGSIKILKKSSDFGNIEVTVNSMYDGETFGELALLSEGLGDNAKRSATCAAGEQTKLLAISKKDYKSILLDEMQNDITGKVKFFKELPFFFACNPISLIPLASNIEPIKYKIDDRIIELGEKSKGLYVIYKGRCSLYWEGYVAKPSTPSLTASVKIRPKTPKPYYTGNLQPRCTMRKQRQDVQGKSVDLGKDELDKAKEYLPKDIQGKKIAKERILWKPLKEGDYFGGRVLVEGLVDINKHIEGNNRAVFGFVESKPAKFTVIAESSEVKVFILTRRHFPLLTEELLAKLKIFLTKDYELDCPKQWSEEFLRASFKEWSQYKQKFMSQVEYENYITKHREQITFSKQ
ncbi:hypothetical protein SteCoe_22822 [Stentor coeruleus]|uniref:Cyclic nucleotide-binding domain-containing protein n=1 Tax=Stentor coeruleus TaxID=5963 RepID=A0A1R2BLI0_9CILI|nr:hypothetical protein SteCoe_22822 [Stentor coeruleus]